MSIFRRCLRPPLTDGMIDTPVLAMIRKGKSHYVCENHLDQRLVQVSRSKKKTLSLKALEKLQSQFDLDEAAHLIDYDRRLVHVPDSCNCCGKYCHYPEYFKQCASKQYLFQVCNHNLVFVDAIHRGTGKSPSSRGPAISSWMKATRYRK